ncbi:rhomboid family intramembrane serine protease [Mycobacterium sp.]|uniref:rhomboid family intramembrane serine protease n=1 Tax=Mycobacterium sp. TaxID=1785 RepID=UPI003C7161D7
MPSPQHGLADHDYRELGSTVLLQTAMTLLFGTASDAQVPTLGASGAIAAVLGAYFVLYPDSRIGTFVLWFPVRIPA